MSPGMAGAGVSTRDEVGTLGPQPGSENAARKMARQLCVYDSGHERKRNLTISNTDEPGTQGAVGKKSDTESQGGL